MIRAPEPAASGSDPVEWLWQAIVTAHHAMLADAVTSMSDAEVEALMTTGEEGVQSTVAKTLPGATVPLWLTLYHLNNRPEVEAAILARDLAALERYDATLDWPERLIIAALRSLAALERAA